MTKIWRKSVADEEAGKLWSQYVDEIVKTAIVAREAAQRIDDLLHPLCNWSVASDYEAHANKIEVGTRVAYARHFLESLGLAGANKDGAILKGCTDPMWHARGTVVSLRETASWTIAIVKWHGRNWRDFPAKINIKNLAKVGPNLAFTGG